MYDWTIITTNKRKCYSVEKFFPKQDGLNRKNRRRLAVGRVASNQTSRLHSPPLFRIISRGTRRGDWGNPRFGCPPPARLLPPPRDRDRPPPRRGRGLLTRWTHQTSETTAVGLSAAALRPLVGPRPVPSWGRALIRVAEAVSGKGEKEKKRRAPRRRAGPNFRGMDDEGSEARVGWLASGNNEAPDLLRLLRASSSCA